MSDFLLEIGTEELPARFLQKMRLSMGKTFGQLLTTRRLAYSDIHIWMTPRRVAVQVLGVEPRQPDSTELLVGPPIRIAFDSDGAPTKAALGFLSRGGIDVEQMQRGPVVGKKGEYIFCEKKVKGRSAAEVLPGLCEQFLTELVWPKSMRWGSGDTLFARPVHWIVCLLGNQVDNQVLPVSFAGVTASANTRGHRFLCPQNQAVSPTNYLATLETMKVIASPEMRKQKVKEGIAAIEKAMEAQLKPDEGLLDEVAYLVEYPVAVGCRFPQEFLHLPPEVIVYAMRSHQRYFAMQKDGALTNLFVTVAGTEVEDMALVRRGNEKVIVARLADAQFFFEEDKKLSPEDWNQKLSGIIYQKDLGSVADKTLRIEKLACDIAAAWKVSSQEMSDVKDAARLCKFDLASQMVGEFPDLQGTMGRYYAKHAGLPDSVCRAIEEHYLPGGASEKPSNSLVAQIVGIADKMDTLLGCFAVGMIPTGSSDPFGLRRAALGIVHTLLFADRPFSISRLVEAAAEALEMVAPRRALPPKSKQDLQKFMHMRCKTVLSENIASDCVAAAMAASWDDVVDTAARAKALAAMKGESGFSEITQLMKRVSNIGKGKGVLADSSAEPNPTLFVTEEEKALWDSYCGLKDRIVAAASRRQYSSCLQVLFELKQPIDDFFDKVLVMDEDAALRENRLALVGTIGRSFAAMADFRQITTESSPLETA